MKQITHSSSVSFHQSNDFLCRPRLHELLKEALNYPLVVMYAGSGYGKTRALYSFLRDYNIYATWLQISERDNIETRYWENYTHLVSLNWPEVGVRLAEIGFPGSEEAFAKFSAILRESANLPEKHIIVIDDFHLLHNSAVLRLIERTVSVINPSNTSVILLSRTAPEFNLIGMMMSDRIFIIREDTLCFTEDEIAEYFNQISLPITRQEIRNIYDDTRGWAFAISLIGRSLINEQKYERSALDAMKKNIFRLIEAELSPVISERLFCFLLRISLIDHLAASLIKSLADDDKLIKEMEKLHAYIRYEFNLDTYLIHHLFLDYLQQKQHLLVDADRRETYQLAGVWCEENSYQVDALSYYEKAEDYDAIMELVYALSLHMPQDMARYAQGIFERMPEEVKAHNPLFPAMNLKLKVNIGQLDESFLLAEEYAEDYESRPDSPEKSRALEEIYGVMAILRMIMCPDTDIYDFDAYFVKQRFYNEKTSSETTETTETSESPAKFLVGAYALLIGVSRAGAPEEYIDALSRSASQASTALQGYLYSLEDLSRGELHYFRREFDDAEQHLKQALDKGRAESQYDIQNRAMLYLMQILFARGDSKGAADMLRGTEELLGVKDYDTRFEAYDIVCSHYYMAIGQPEQIPEWLKGDFSNHGHPAFLRYYANRIKAQYHYMTRQYSTLLAFLDSISESQKLLIGRIVFKILEALSFYKLKRRDKAIAALTEAYRLAEPNRIIVPFSQYARDMRTLTSAALRDKKCSIPKPWLENINRKASAFAKKQGYVIAENNPAALNKDEIILTNRETKVLQELAQGLSRTEIAASQDISVNTVKMIINIIYEKLRASSLVDAIRIATDRKII